jgi:hypothetical protein
MGEKNSLSADMSLTEAKRSFFFGIYLPFLPQRKQIYIFATEGTENASFFRH